MTQDVPEGASAKVSLFFSIRCVSFVELQGPGPVARKAPGRNVAGLGCGRGRGLRP